MVPEASSDHDPVVKWTSCMYTETNRSSTNLSMFVQYNPHDRNLRKKSYESSLFQHNWD